MSEGYHSRSPEEFRKYLESLNKKTGKRNWRNIVMFLDLLLIILVMYMVNRNLNPDWSAKKSNKVSIENIELYFTRNTDIKSDKVVYFLMLTNKGNSEISFPDSSITNKYTITTEEKLDCYSYSPNLESKIILPGKTGYYSFEIEKKNLLENKPPECQKIVYDPKRNTFVSRLLGDKNKGGTSTLEVNWNNQILKMVIEKDLW